MIYCIVTSENNKGGFTTKTKVFAGGKLCDDLPVCCTTSSETLKASLEEAVRLLVAASERSDLAEKAVEEVAKTAPDAVYTETHCGSGFGPTDGAQKRTKKGGKSVRSSS